MSLLMDALKKAEQEKKKLAEKEPDGMVADDYAEHINPPNTPTHAANEHISLQPKEPPVAITSVPNEIEPAATIPPSVNADLIYDKDQSIRLTPVVASTVFQALKPAKSWQQWLPIFAVCLISTTVLSALYYLNVENSNRNMQNFSLDNVNFSIPELPVATSSPSLSSIDTDKQQTLPTFVDDEQTVIEEIKQVVNELPADTDDVKATSTESRETLVDKKKTEQTELSVSQQDHLMIIEVDRKMAQDKHGVLLNLAYVAYEQGDYNIAKNHYSTVLAELPTNRDALLGIAAIAVQRDDIKAAQAIYLQILELYPDDSIATVALTNLQNETERAHSESMIREFLQRHPTSAFLHFSLGNLYASQSRWTEAQQAFFDAFRFDSNNPDYAFNLAVSLEHLGQSRNALDYYRIALASPQKNNIHFDMAALRTRIDTLSGDSGGAPY